jgi:hypothetical protein
VFFVYALIEHEQLILKSRLLAFEEAARHPKKRLKQKISHILKNDLFYEKNDSLESFRLYQPKTLLRKLKINFPESAARALSKHRRETRKKNF